MKLVKIDSVYQFIRGEMWTALVDLVSGTFVLPRFAYQSVNAAQVEASLTKLNSNLKFLNDNYFKDSYNFVVGNSLSLADVGLGTLIFWAVNVQEAPFNLATYPKINVWWNNMMSQPHFQKAHKATIDFITPLRPNFKATMGPFFAPLITNGPQAKPGKQWRGSFILVSFIQQF